MHYAITPRRAFCIFPPRPLPLFYTAIPKLGNTQNSRHHTRSAMLSQDKASDSSDSLNRERIHVLGIGNIGLFFAHSLAKSLDAPPITLLLHRHNLLKEWEKNGESILIVRRNLPDVALGFDVELVQPPGAEPQSKIANLIVATKATKTVEAVSSISHRLTPASTVLFTQNGMGVISKVNSSLFPNSSKRPCYLAAVNTHGVKSSPTQPFQAVHAGIGKVAIGRDPGHANQGVEPKNWQGRYLIDQIVKTKSLVATEVDAQELLCLQMEKLVVNAIINPLTTLLDCENGALFRTDELKDVIRILVEEAVGVIEELPGTQVAGRFETERLIDYVRQVGIYTGSNTSSMLQDSRAGRETEIDYINGWIIDKGKETGKEVGNHEMLMKMVKDGKKVSFQVARESFSRGSSR